MSLFEFFVTAQAWASAAGAEHHAPSINDIWFPLGNFLIFAFILARYALPPVQGFLRSRREEVLTALKQASAKRQQAEALMQEYKERLARVDQEIQSIIAELRAAAEREKTKLLGEAQTLAAKIKQDARFLGDQEIKVARQRLREEMANQAATLARDLIQRHLSSADQARLVEEFVQSIGQVR